MSETCKERWLEAKNNRIADIRKLWKLYQSGDEEGDPDLGTFDEYGLGFDYVPARTFRDQTVGFFRWQISTGGPGEEFRFYADFEGYLTHAAFVFLDWFDGHERMLTGKDADLMEEIFADWRKVGALDSAVLQARGRTE